MHSRDSTVLSTNTSTTTLPPGKSQPQEPQQQQQELSLFPAPVALVPRGGYGSAYIAHQQVGSTQAGKGVQATPGTWW